MRPSISGGTPDSSVSEGDGGGFRLHDRRKDSAPARTGGNNNNDKKKK